MRRLAKMASLALLLGACTTNKVEFADLKIKTVANQPYNSLMIVAPLALTTPPVNQILLGPCEPEFAVPDGRRANCNIHHKLYGTIPPWREAQIRAQMMAYGPGELQCWKTLGVAECIVVAGPARPVNTIAPNMGSN